MSLLDIKSMFLSEIESDFQQSNLAKYRAKQVYSWLTRGVTSFDEMTDLSLSLREKLKTKYYIANCIIEKKLVSSYDGIVKYLFKLNDGEYIESVLMKYHHGYTICISTQVGCKMGCKFCATGMSGFSRNLTPSEMISQIQRAQLDNGVRISNVVLMGMGEPLDNYDNVLRFLKLISDSNGMNIGARHISLSTCGIVDKIYKLAEEGLQITLSVSLHAPEDKLRNDIMPINKRFNVDELLSACRFYQSKTNRRISFEYAMIDGLNDSEGCAKILSRKLKNMLCHVNLIPVNSNGSKSIYKKSGKENLDKFIKILEREKIPVTVRRTLGSDIQASCGQLRRNVSIKGGESF